MRAWWRALSPWPAGFVVTGVALLVWFAVQSLLRRSGLLDLPTVPDAILGLVVGYGCGRLGRFVRRTREADAEVKALRESIEQHERDGRNGR